jgi:HAD superfamily hydrolase (TIGR01509 family)
MIRALLIDLDGVIRIWDEAHDRLTEQHFGLPPGTMRSIAFAPALLELVITGKTTDEAWRHQIEQRLAEQFPWCDAAAATQHWSTSAGAVDQQMLALVRQCRGYIPVGLITNATSRLSRDLEHLHLSGEFDVIINSSVIGAAKPHRDIFLAALDALRAQPATTLFIDDSPGHVLAACDLSTIQYRYDKPPTQRHASAACEA